MKRIMIIAICIFTFIASNSAIASDKIAESCYAVKDISEFLIIADMIENDKKAFNKMKEQGRVVLFSKDTQVFVTGNGLLIESMPFLKIRLKGEIEEWGVPEDWVLRP